MRRERLLKVVLTHSTLYQLQAAVESIDCRGQELLKRMFSAGAEFSVAHTDRDSLATNQVIRWKQQQRLPNNLTSFILALRARVRSRSDSRYHPSTLTCSRRHLNIACFLLLSLIAATAQRKSPEELYNEAVAADQRGDTQKAIALYQQMIALQPGSVQAHSNLGVALVHAGRYSEAITQYHEALKRDPHNAVIQLNLALARYKQADFENAASELVKLRKQQPDNKQSLYLLADCYLRLGRDSDAVALLTPAYQADPGDHAVQYALGRALILEGRSSKAKPSLIAF